MGLVGEDVDDGDLAGLEGPGIGEDGVLFFLALGRHFGHYLLVLQRVGQGCT